MVRAPAATEMPNVAARCRMSPISLCVPGLSTAIQAASVNIEVADHPAMAGLASPWMRTDEWYDFQTNPRGSVTVS